MFIPLQNYMEISKLADCLYFHSKCPNNPSISKNTEKESAAFGFVFADPPKLLVGCDLATVNTVIPDHGKQFILKDIRYQHYPSRVSSLWISS